MSLVDGTKQRAFDPPSVLIQSEETEKVNAEGNRGPGARARNYEKRKESRVATQEDLKRKPSLFTSAVSLAACFPTGTNLSENPLIVRLYPNIDR